jgi:hypothetical protein
MKKRVAKGANYVSNLRGEVVAEVYEKRWAKLLVVKIFF